jgi:hypothetical protein
LGETNERIEMTAIIAFLILAGLLVLACCAMAGYVDKDEVNNESDLQ